MDNEGMDDDEPAFPKAACIFPNGEIADTSNEGMTLRDYFAGQALVGMLCEDEGQPCIGRTPEAIEKEQRNYAAMIAKSSYRYADAMLAEREKPKT